MATGLQASIANFIHRYIHSFEELEVLLLLSASPGRRWTAQQVDESIRSNLESIERRLDQLVEHQLVARYTDGDTIQFQFHPVTQDLTVLVEQLAKAYKEHRVSVIEQIFAEPPSSIQSFADSFRIRRKDNDA